MFKFIRRIGVLLPTNEEEKDKNHIRRNFGTCASHVCDGGNEIQDYELAGSCGNHGGREKCV